MKVGESIRIKPCMKSVPSSPVRIVEFSLWQTEFDVYVQDKLAYWLF